MIQRKTEKNLIEYLTPRLFDKLEIKPLEAEFCPKGYVFGAGGLQMNVRELGKFGQLYLQRGKWKGEQILSEKWIEESTKKQVECGDYNNSQVDGYGYLFWHLKGDAYMANGKYGQYCIVLSDQNSVISVNSPETEQSDRVGRYIMKKLKEGEGIMEKNKKKYGLLVAVALCVCLLGGFLANLAQTDFGKVTKKTILFESKFWTYELVQMY